MPLLLSSVVVLWAGYAAFSPAPPKPDATWVRIQNERVLRIGIDPSFPPFEADDGKGNLSGFDIGLATNLAQKWNVKIQYVYTGFDGLYDALIGSQFDVILSALPYDPQKTQDVLFSHSYFNGGPVIAVRAEDNTTKGLFDVAQQPVAAELGTSGDAVARKWVLRLKLDLHEFGTSDDALRAVQQGRVSAALVDPISFYDFEKTAGANLKAVGKNLNDELYVVAVRRDSPTLLEQLNSAVDIMKQDGTLDSLERKWF